MKLNKFFVAITGGIGSGKSCVTKIISSLGYTVVSADTVARNIYDDAEVFKQIQEAFPQCVKDGKVDRKELADFVFRNKENVLRLNQITHPAILRRLFNKMEEKEDDICFAEVPLLFESGAENNFDRVIVVVRNQIKRIKAVMERDGLTEREVLNRIKNQYDYEKNSLSGHTVIYNDGDLASLEKQVVQVVNEITSSYKN